MKTKVFFLALVSLMLIASSSMAQIKVGGGIWYGSDINTVGISVDGKYLFTEEWAAAGRFTYFFDSDINWSSLDLDANYTFTTIENVGTLYGLAGLDFLFFKYDIGIDMGGYGMYSDSFNETYVGFNLGLGMNYALSETLDLNPELRYTFGNANFFRIGATLLYTF